jgi:hypothetical protein
MSLLAVVGTTGKSFDRAIASWAVIGSVSFRGFRLLQPDSQAECHLLSDSLILVPTAQEKNKTESPERAHPTLSSFPVFESGAVAQTEQIVGLHRRAVLHQNLSAERQRNLNAKRLGVRARRRRFGPEYKTSSTKAGCAPTPECFGEIRVGTSWPNVIRSLP